MTCAFGVGRIPKIDEDLMPINDSNGGEDAERLSQNTRESLLPVHDMEEHWQRWRRNGVHCLSIVAPRRKALALSMILSM